MQFKLETILDSASAKNRVNEETNCQKRTLLHVDSSSSNASPKKQKFENIKCSSPQPGCSTNFNEVKNKGRFIKPQLVVKTKIPIPDASEDVFQEFTKTCLKKRDDENTKIILQKLEKLYNNLSPFHKSNNELRLFINSCHERITEGLSHDIYTPILDVRTEIKNHLQLAKQATPSNAENNFEEIEMSKGDMKKIKLLEESITECLKKIKELEKKEVNFEEDNDSAYIQEDKYKKRLIQLCNMLSKITGDKIIRKQILKKKIKRSDIADEMTGISSVDEAILNFVNSDIAKINRLKYLESKRIADHIKMPEYLDILKCIEKCNKNSNLDLSKEKMNRLAKKAFQTVVIFLKNRRQTETKIYMQSLLDHHDGSEDPAINDIDLDQKLQKNKKEGDKKLEEIFKKYVDKQEGFHEEEIEKQSDDINSETDSETDDTENEDFYNLSSSVNEENCNDISNKNSKSGSVEKIPLVEDECKAHTSTLYINNKKNSITNESKDKSNIKKYDVKGNSKKLLTTKATLCKSSTSENRMIAEKDDDILIINDDSDNTMVAKDSSDMSVAESKILTKPTEVLQINIEDSQSVQSQIASSTRINENSPTNISSKKVVDVAKASFIKVRAFAKPPPAWGDSSPEKLKAKSKGPVQQRLQELSKLEYINLTKEREKHLRSPSTRSINPLANIKYALPPAKRVVIVKNVINNYNVPFRVDSMKSSKDVQVVSRIRQNITSARGGDGGGDQIANKANENGVKSAWLSKEKGDVNKRPYTK
ncbi:death domain-associated protein 6-like isoform X2 [Phymastichus coffea]|uniref:death domain-associated protein 6-like isoform X2 n=1 Tax=Phymastichus coffea TaxID=108790 RepID=UPI00273CD4A1|nr:death domain-associated protein 6-like isoform X2 [Phymastichus coffea]